MLNVIPAFPGMKLVMPCQRGDGSYEALLTDIIAWEINRGLENDWPHVETVTPITPGDQMSLREETGIVGTGGNVETIGGTYYSSVDEYIDGEFSK